MDQRRRWSETLAWDLVQPIVTAIRRKYGNDMAQDAYLVFTKALRRYRFKPASFPYYFRICLYNHIRRVKRDQEKTIQSDIDVRHDGYINGHLISDLLPFLSDTEAEIMLLIGHGIDPERRFDRQTIASCLSAIKRLSEDYRRDLT